MKNTYNSRNRPATISADGWSLELSYGSGLQREKTVLKQGNSIKRTTYHISKDCELDILPACTCSRYMDYIFADGKIVAIHVHNTAANADSMYYEPIALALSASEELAGLTLMRPLASFGDRIVDIWSYDSKPNVGVVIFIYNRYPKFNKCCQ